MGRTVVLNVVGLTQDLLGPDTPRLSAFASAGQIATIGPVLPAVTCSVQATYLTGAWPDAHGIVGNGWYFRDECEVKFWRQSNRLIQQPKIWDRARALDPGLNFTCANLFWWFNMYSSVDYAVTPRPMYPADGRKLPDVWTQPADLRTSLQAELGQFPLFNYWGPATSVSVSRWIAGAARRVEQRYRPTLTLIYLPHLDYVLQRDGPGHSNVSRDLREIDQVCGELIDAYQADGVQVVVLSEYGISPVRRPVHLNRRLREHGLVAVREELGRELLDAGASAAFAVADHQVAHVYVNDAARLQEVRALVESTEGVAEVLDQSAKQAHHLDHPRAGDLVAIAERDAWFTYYYWLDDRRAPDFARTVDIHRKPGYDPVELFLDPERKLLKARLGLTLLKRRLGFRALLEATPLDASLVRGSHGRAPDSARESPVFITQQGELLGSSVVDPTDVCDVLLRHLSPAATPALPRMQ